MIVAQRETGPAISFGASIVISLINIWGFWSRNMQFFSVFLKTMFFVMFLIFRHSFFKFLDSRIHWKSKEGFFQFVL